jgi:hypothetical protein
MSDKSLPETKGYGSKRPLNAPSFMRPRRPVLDEPLELDGTKRHAGAINSTDEVPVSVPANQAVILNPPVVEAEPEVEDINDGVIPDEASTETVIAEPETAEPEPIAEEVPVVEADPVMDALTADPEDLQVLLDQLKASDLTGKRRLSPFQSLIVVLLVVLVILVLAMVFLYAAGMIQLPPVMMNVIDKGLELVQ